jgi:prepilin-type N-terminal cleavage/methylation domain-containing protein
LIRRLRQGRLVGNERGYSMTELLVVMSIMGVVMAGLTQIFVSGSKAETDMNRRFQAQQDSRLALDRIRRDIHCASDTSPYSQSSITLVSSGCGNVTWCTAAVAGFTGRYRLYRQAGSTCSSSTGLPVADNLTTGNVFTAFTHSTGYLAALSVDFPVSVKGTNVGRYELKDTIYLRNSVRG